MVSNPYEPPNSRPPGLRETTTAPRRRMTPREVFGIVVRTVGLVAVVWGLWGAAGALFPEANSKPSDYLVGYVPIGFIGFVLLVGADSVVSLAYGTRYMEHVDESELPSSDSNDNDPRG